MKPLLHAVAFMLCLCIGVAVVATAIDAGAGPFAARKAAKVEKAAAEKTVAVEAVKVEGVFAHRRFANVVIRAAGRQLAAGKLTQAQYDSVIAATDNANLMAAVEDKAAEVIVRTKVRGTDGSAPMTTVEVKRDWSAFLQWVTEVLMPFLMKLIALFGGL